MSLIPFKRKRTPLFRPNSIRQLLKAVRKGHVSLREPTRLERLRYAKHANAPVHVTDEASNIDWDKMAEERLGQT